MSLSIRIATPADLPALRQLADLCNDAPYALSAVMEEKCFGDGVAGAPQTRIASSGRGPAGFVVTCGSSIRLIGVARERRREGIGTALLMDVEEQLAGSGSGRARVGAEAGNYFTPGVVTSDVATLEFFTQRGYGQHHVTDNLETALAGNALLAPVLAAKVRRARDEEEPRVLAFIEREFGAVWRFESTPAFRAELPNVFISEEAGELTGFAVHEANNRGLGFFGPTGVATSLRGRGLGRALLVASLLDLQRLGHERAIIPWTDALEFYRKSCGAVPRDRFVTPYKTF